jgi:hypothetical protein
VPETGTILMIYTHDNHSLELNPSLLSNNKVTKSVQSVHRGEQVLTRSIMQELLCLVKIAIKNYQRLLLHCFFLVLSLLSDLAGS